MLTLATFAPAEDAPLWWTQRGIIRLDAGGQPVPASDFSLLNQGQLKQLATQAVAEMNARLAGGAGPALNALVATWSTPVPQTDDYTVITIGQLKNTAGPFYLRLAEVGYRGQPITFAIAGATYPWSPATNDDSDFSYANLGQAKRLFCFDFVRDINGDGVPDWQDADGDGLPDAWELAFAPNLTTFGAGDSDNDGAGDLLEFQNNTAPNDPPPTVILLTPMGAQVLP